MKTVDFVKLGYGMVEKRLNPGSKNWDGQIHHFWHIVRDPFFGKHS